MSGWLVFVQLREGGYREVSCTSRCIRALILITDVGLPYHESSVKRLPWLHRVTNPLGVTVLEADVTRTTQVQSRELHLDPRGHLSRTCM